MLKKSTVKRAVCLALCLCCIAAGTGAFAEKAAVWGLRDLSEVSFSPWAGDTLHEAYESGLLDKSFDLGKDYTSSITREQFMHLMMEFVAAEKGESVKSLAETAGLIAADVTGEFKSPFEDTGSLHTVLAAAMGIAKGSGGLFRPNEYISRSEAATLLYRCMSELGEGEANSSPLPFEDAYEMPRWATEAIKYCSGRVTPEGSSVMGGAAGKFSPLGSYTIEQSIATLLRCSKSIGAETVFDGWREAEGYDSVSLALTFGGDCTFGSGIGFSYKGSFDEMYSMVEPSYFFGGIEEFFTDDLTMVNFEGTLTGAAAHANKTFCFKGLPEYAGVLPAGSVDVVTVANNHSMDYLKRGFEDTVTNLSPVVAVSGYDLLPIVEVKGVKIGFASNVAWAFDTAQKEFIDNSVANLRERGAEIIIFNFHWGIERAYKSNSTQQKIAHYCIERGADLVIGHHPHVVQETETYKGKQIAYSLGNLVFGGNQNPQDKNCMIFRQSFTVNLDSREVSDAGFSAIPYKVSSVNWRNDYRPAKR